MKSRFVLVLIAVVLALVATAGSALYLQSLKASVIKGNETVKVLTATQAISPGLSLEEMLNRNMVAFTAMPQRYMATGAITNAQGMSDRVLTVYVSKGEQLTQQKLQAKSGAGLGFRIPKGKVAVAIPVDEVVGVSDHIAAGDKVSIIATFSPGPDGPDASRTLLQNVPVLATSSSADGVSAPKSGALAQSGTAQGKKTITLAVSPQEAEKLVFAEEKGHVWVTLQATGETDVTKTGGQTVNSVFR